MSGCSTVEKALIVNKANTVIVYGENANNVQKNAANDLKLDIQKVYPNEKIEVLKVSSLQSATYDKLIVVGTPSSNQLIAQFIKGNKDGIFSGNLEPETFILKSGMSKNKVPITYIIGADDRGTYYGVYEFSKSVLDIDHYEYWTDRKPAQKDHFEIPKLSFREKAPVFPLRGYFDNDNDMLANWKGRKLIVELDTWKEMINSLCRMRYNYIDPFDLLGRAVYRRKYYTDMIGEYHTDLELVEQVIDYAHSKGMLVQIPLYLGYEFHHIDPKRLSVSKDVDHWLDVVDYYLTKTPLGKADLYLQRPRHPYIDHPYKSTKEEVAAGLKPGPLMTEWFNRLHKKVLEHNPKAIFVCDLWGTGRPMWKEGTFAPSKDIMFLWADYGEAEFREWPEDLQGYEFGIYIHAGVWQDNVMQNPYPGLIKDAVTEAGKRKMTNNIFVNGQDFKHFILNLEACAEAAWDPEGFDPEEFYKNWTSRYFGENVSEAVIASLKELHEAHLPHDTAGFRKISKNIKNLVRDLKKGKIKKINPYKFDHLEHARKSYQIAKEAESKVAKDKLNVYDDQILFPARIYKENLEWKEALIQYNNALWEAKNNPGRLTQEEITKKGLISKGKLITLRNSLDEGSRWKKWDGWTKCENFRISTPPAKIKDVERILKKYSNPPHLQ